MTTIKDVEVNPLEERVEKLEELVNALVKSRAMDKMYTDADINGTRQSVANITPYTETKKAFYGYDALPFYDVPNGNVSVFFSNYNGEYAVKRVGYGLLVTFEKLTNPTDVTISITQ